MKILFSPCHYTYDEMTGGSEPFWAFSIADKLCNRFPESVVVTGFKNIKTAKKYEIIEVQPNKKNLDFSIKNSIIFNWKYFLKTRDLMQSRRFDILHHVLPFGLGSTFNLNFIFFKNSPLVLGPLQSSLNTTNSDLDTSDIRNFKKKGNNLSLNFSLIFSPLLNFLSDLTLKKSDAIIVINKYTKRILIDKGIPTDKIYIIPPGVDVQLYEHKKIQNLDAPTFLALCYLIERKRVDLIIKSFAKIIKNGHKAELLIVGDGPQKQYLEELTIKLGIEDRVNFAGFVPNYKTKDYYQKGDIFINMSTSEGFATTCLEALAAGMPIISTRVGGFNEAIKNNINGYLIDINDESALLEKMTKFIQNQKLIYQMGKASKDMAKRYDWDSVIIPQYVNLYEYLKHKYGRQL